jgi:hypothetical protein
MGHSGRIGNGRGEPPSAEIDDAQPNHVPRATGLFGAARFEGMHAEREEAVEQIDRTLKAWRKASGASTGAAKIPQSGGSALDGGVRQAMEPRLGGSLADVRVHTGGESQEAATELGARAFTVGNEVHFNQGQFAPGTKEGDRLLAHELTHVVQGQKGGIQRDAAAGDEEKGGPEVSQPEEPAEKEADAKGDEVADELHGEKKKEAGGDDGKHAKDEANAPEEEEEKKKGEAPQEAAPATGAKLYRRIYLGGRQTKPKPKKPLPAVDPKIREEMDAIKAWIEKEAQKAKSLWSTAAIPVGTVLVSAGKAAAVGAGVAGGVGAAAGAVLGLLAGVFGIGHAKHQIMAEKAALLDNLDLLIHQPEVIHEIYDYCTTLKPPLAKVAAKIEAATAELSRKEKQRADEDKKAQARKQKQADKKQRQQDRKAGKDPAPKKGHSLEQQAGHAAHAGHVGAEGVEAAAETGAAVAEGVAHAGGTAEGVAHALETVAPVLEGVAHVAQDAAVGVGAVVAGLDWKTFRDKSKKYDKLKEKADKT